MRIKLLQGLCPWDEKNEKRKGMIPETRLLGTPGPG
jgi:hypothetical protein